MKLFLLLFFSTLAFSSWSQSTEEDNEEKSCTHLHKGKYIMIAQAGGEIIVKRKKKVQIERYNKERQKYRFQLEWISDCEYVLTLKKVRGKKWAHEYEGTKTYVRIENPHFDYYTAYVKKEGGEETNVEVTKLR